MENSIFKYGKDIEWSLPLLFQYEPVLITINDCLEFYGIKPGKVNLFGAPSCMWAGGRVPAVGISVDIPQIRKVFNFLKTYNAIPTFTFSYTNITKYNLEDSYCNSLLDLGIEIGARFIVYSDLLRDYIKEKSPNSTVVASVIKPSFRFQGDEKLEEPTIENETNYYNQLLKEYDVVVVRPEYSRKVLIEHPEYIDDISRIEVLINQPCMTECPRCQEHYRSQQASRLNYNTVSKKFACICNTMTPKEFADLTLAHTEEEVKKLVANGVNKLKLQGRGVGHPIYHLLYNLYYSMFNTDGKNYLPAEYLYVNFERNMDRFNSLFEQRHNY